MARHWNAARVCRDLEDEYALGIRPTCVMAQRAAHRPGRHRTVWPPPAAADALEPTNRRAQTEGCRQARGVRG